MARDAIIAHEDSEVLGYNLAVVRRGTLVGQIALALVQLLTLLTKSETKKTHGTRHVKFLPFNKGHYIREGLDSCGIIMQKREKRI